MKNEILIRNGYLPLPVNGYVGQNASKRFLATIYSNLLYYGFAPNVEAYTTLSKCSDAELSDWWTTIEKTLKKVTGANKEIGKYIVYKNFPKEVLDMTQAEYWIRQIFVYFGLPYDGVRQEEKDRDNVIENLPVKVLAPATEASLPKILTGLFGMGNRWTPEQKTWAFTLFFDEKIAGDISKIPFKENLVDVLAACMDKKIKVDAFVSAMDVLRLAAVLSGSTADLKQKFKFRKFKNQERKFLGRLLNRHSTDALVADFARDKEKWKRLLERIHPNDFGFRKVSDAYDKLYNKTAYSDASWLEYYIQNKDAEVFKVIKAGDFMRRLKHLYSVFGVKAFNEFKKRLGELSNLQLLKIRRQLDWHNFQNTRMFPPKGNWSRVKIADNVWNINQNDIDLLVAAIDQKLSQNLAGLTPIKFDKNVDFVKLQTNDSDMLPYGRGTVFPIPDNITFLRSASYWQANRTCWMDNGWNFFDANWNPISTCCWNSNPTGRNGKYAVFSGDPVNSGEMKGRAGQMIDIYLDKLADAGIRYAVWNVLSYSRIKFDNLQDVYVALQWGEQPQANKVFEPSRAILNAPLKGQSLTKYVALVDVQARQLVYLDANFKGNVSSASLNAKNLSEVMPAYLEYLERLPSVGDLFQNAPKAGPRTKNFIYVGYDDNNVELTGQKAYVFRPSNEANVFEKFDINKVLNEK